MTSFASSTGTIPLVFESGVLNICEDGTVEIHLSHSVEEPHPMMTHPDGGETNIPKKLSQVDLVGNDRGTVSISCGIPEVDTLPTGFVFRIKGWKHIQLEMSGDLTVVMSEMEETPDWFQLEKVHRFDGPEDGVRLYSGSQPFVDIKARVQPAPPPSASPKSSQTETDTKQSTHNYTQSKPNSGCGLLVMFLTCIGVAQYIL